jgi:hypothetical protein
LNKVLTDSLWALSYLSDGNGEDIQAVIDGHVCPRIVFLLKSDHVSLNAKVPALRVIGNLTTGGDDQTQVAVDSGGLDVLFDIVQQGLEEPNHKLLKEGLWVR